MRPRSDQPVGEQLRQARQAAGWRPDELVQPPEQVEALADLERATDAAIGEGMQHLALLRVFAHRLNVNPEPWVQQALAAAGRDDHDAAPGAQPLPPVTPTPARPLRDRVPRWRPGALSTRALPAWALPTRALPARALPVAALVLLGVVAMLAVWALPRAGQQGDVVELRDASSAAASDVDEGPSESEPGGLDLDRIDVPGSDDAEDSDVEDL